MGIYDASDPHQILHFIEEAFGPQKPLKVFVHPTRANELAEILADKNYVFLEIAESSMVNPAIFYILDVHPERELPGIPRRRQGHAHE